MALDTAGGRAQSIQNTLAHVTELWVLSKIVEAVDGETIRRDYWYIEFTMNNPFAFIRSRTFNREFTIYYQPSIYPHITSAFTGGGRLHLIPDIVVFEGVVDEFLNWGGLHRLIDGGRSPLLIVEVKTGVEPLSGGVGLTTWLSS